MTIFCMFFIRLSKIPDLVENLKAVAEILVKDERERSSKIKSFSPADLLLPQSSLVGYFGIPAIVLIAVVIEKNGIDIPMFLTGEQEIAECLFAAGVFLHSCKLYLKLDF